MIRGDQFADGRSRLILGTELSAEMESKIIAALDEADRLRRTQEALVKLNAIIEANEIRMEQP